MYEIVAPLRVAFAAIAGFTFTPTQTEPLRAPLTPITATAEDRPTLNLPTYTKDDEGRLTAYFNHAIEENGQRSIAQCSPALDNKKGPIGNKDMQAITSVNQFMNDLPGDSAIRMKALIGLAHNQGYTVCFDNRMPEVGVKFSLNLNERVIGLSPEVVPGVDPMKYYQATYSAALMSLYKLTKGFEAAKIARFPGVSDSAAPYITIPFNDINPAQIVPDPDIIKKLTPAPVKGADYPFELQKEFNVQLT